MAEVSSKWGNRPGHHRPGAGRPYTYRWTEASTGGQPITRTETRNAIFLPEKLEARGSIDSEIRNRGIFTVPVYKLGLTVEGEFARPSFSELAIEPAAVAWERAHLAIGISDARAIQEETAVSWNGKQVCSAFQAKWSIPFLGRNYPQAWRAEAAMREAIDGSRFGVELVNPVDHYRMAERSVKYAGLFILLTFATVWLIEVLAGVRVHPLQYLMLGGALCLFYLLELSLSEHLGFPLAYAIASISVIGMVAAYCVVVLHRMRRALVVGAGVALLYAYLYILLMNEDYALVIGSVGLFAILAAIMYLTRRVDWYAVGARSPVSSEPS